MIAHAPQEGTHTILIVDDHEDIRETLSDVLEFVGYQVATAVNGLDALRYLRNHPPPCLILLDLTMPVMNGWDFRQQQMQDPQLAGIPVVVVSGTNPVYNPIPLEAVHTFVKPVDIPALLDTVGQHC